MKCRNCNKKKFIKIIKIGSQPISSRSYKKPTKLREYPLDLFICEHCDLVQLSKVAPAKKYGNLRLLDGLKPFDDKHMKKKDEFLKQGKLKKNAKF